MRQVCLVMDALCLTALLLVGFGCSDSKDTVEPARFDLVNGGTTLSAEKGEALDYPMEVSSNSETDSIDWSVVAVGRKPGGVFGINTDGVFQFTPAVIDESLTYQFHITARDQRGAVAETDLSVEVGEMAVGFPGDLDNNGIVDIDDAILYEGHIHSIPGYEIDTPDELGAADANRDGYSPTIADQYFIFQSYFGELVMDIDVINPFADTVVVTVDGDAVIIETDVSIEAIWVKFSSSIFSLYDLCNGLTIVTNSAGSPISTHACIIDAFSSDHFHLDPGTHTLCRVSGDVEIEYFEAVDYTGNMVYVELKQN